MIKDLKTSFSTTLRDTKAKTQSAPNNMKLNYLFKFKKIVEISKQIIVYLNNITFFDLQQSAQFVSIFTSGA